MLSVNQLYFKHEDQGLFENLSFQVHPGEALEIQGANGSGKTTLLKLLAGFLAPDSGHITISSKIAYMGHAPAFTPWLTVAENMSFTAMLYYSHIKNIPNNKEIALILEQFSLKPQAALFPHQLSEGQKRRLSLGLLSLSQAKIWLLDEPFTALDRQACKLLQSLIIEHIFLKGIVVMTTHQAIVWPETMPLRQMILSAYHSYDLSTSDF